MSTIERSVITSAAPEAVFASPLDVQNGTTTTSERR